MIYSQKVTLVPIKEMTDVVSVEKKLVEIDQDTWVRVKIGIYKGDLAKVYGAYLSPLLCMPPSQLTASLTSVYL